MNVLITGITGAGGSYLAEYIINNHPDVKVYGLHRWHSATHLNNIDGIKNKVILLETDLNDLSSVIRALQISKPDKIFHLAAYANVRKCFDTPLSVISNNIMGTANLLEGIRLTCPDTCLQICSTCEVYGNHKTEAPVTEDSPLNPQNPYSVSKLTAEKLAISYFHTWGIKVIVTRAFSYINPRRLDLVASAFAYQIAKIEAGKQDVLNHGNMESWRSFIDVRDIAEAYWIASERCHPGIPYNIGGGHPMMVGMLFSIMKYNARTPIVGVRDKRLLRPVDVDYQIPDISRFENQTGFKARHSLDESLHWLLENMRELVKNEN